jgi:hypothetical protein
VSVNRVERRVVGVRGVFDRAIDELSGVFVEHVQHLRLDEDLEVLAQALEAEAGRFENAVELQSRLVEEADERGEERVIRRLRAHLACTRTAHPAAGLWRRTRPRRR